MYTIELYKAQIDRIVNKGKLIGYATITIAHEVVIHNIALFKTDDGYNFKMPQREYYDKDGNKQYTNIALPITAVARESILNALVKAYKSKTE